jgi:phosphonate transport system substrate-binding protein
MITIARRTLLAAGAASLVPATGRSQDWRTRYPTLAMGVITSENEADRIVRYRPVVSYLERVLGVRIEFRNATDYAGVVEALNANKLQIAHLGPAAYAQAWIVSGGKVLPIAATVDAAGDFGYFSVVVVRSDSPYRSIDDLRGKKLAFADPNSASGFQAPAFFMREAGYDPTKFFASTAFSGSHENSVIALLNGTFDAAATWWNNDERSNYARMWDKGMIPRNSVRVVWKSPQLPSSPLTVRTDMPEDLRIAVKQAFIRMKDLDKEAWPALGDGKLGGYREVSHADYEAMVRLVRDNQRARRAS